VFGIILWWKTKLLSTARCRPQLKFATKVVPLPL
jgi:hypothetical protein